MGCDTSSHNATPPTPAIAPPIPRPTGGPTVGANGGPDDLAPAGEDIEPDRAAERQLARWSGAAIDPRVTALVPGFDAPFYQAGLAGYSDAAMRLIARRHGCPMCVTEALLDRTLLAGGRGFAKADLGEIETNVPGGRADRPLSGQIMGSEPAEMAAAAIKMIEQGRRSAKDYRLLAERAAADGADGPGPAAERRERAEDAPGFAAIDVNLACPVKKIQKKARGGHWLAEPCGAIAILRAVREAVPATIPVTVKMRRAFDDTPEMAENFLRIFDAAYDMGCAWVTVHARTVEQKYVGPSRWDLLREIVQRRHPGRHGERIVFGSGDIWSPGDVFRMIEYCSSERAALAGASIARGCIGNPWIFRQCRDLLAGRVPAPPTLAEQRGVLEDHFALALAVNAGTRRPELHTGKTMRKFAIRFAEHHPERERVRARFIAVDSLESWRAVLDDWYPRGDPRCNAPAADRAASTGPAALGAPR